MIKTYDNLDLGNVISSDTACEEILSSKEPQNLIVGLEFSNKNTHLEVEEIEACIAERIGVDLDTEQAPYGVYSTKFTLNSLLKAYNTKFHGQPRLVLAELGISKNISTGRYIIPSPDAKKACAKMLEYGTRIRKATAIVGERVEFRKTTIKSVKTIDNPYYIESLKTADQQHHGIPYDKGFMSSYDRGTLGTI